MQPHGVLKKVGYAIMRQRGSHMRLRHADPTRKPLTIPRHASLGKGLLRKILRDAEMTVEDFERLLKNR